MCSAFTNLQMVRHLLIHPKVQRQERLKFLYIYWTLECIFDNMALYFEYRINLEI